MTNRIDKTATKAIASVDHLGTAIHETTTRAGQRIVDATKKLEKQVHGVDKLHGIAKTVGKTMKRDGNKIEKALRRAPKARS